MKGKTRCPYCNEYVIVEVPDGATGYQTVVCPNCGMKIKVNVTQKDKEEKELKIHPAIRNMPSNKLMIAGLLLIISSILGFMMGGAILSSPQILSSGYGYYEGYVVDEDGNAVENASIYLDGNFITMSDENGHFIIKNVSAGEHTMEIEKEGYKKLNVKIFVISHNISKMMKMKFRLERGEGISQDRDIFSVIMKTFPIMSAGIIIISIIPLIGGITCFLKKSFIFSIIASVFGILSIGFFIGSVLSIIALIIILLNRHEFGGEVKY